ncbi:MAG: DUF1707 domain-containing protein [Actinomycetota bacterium]|nr:DUF1707 domain-containing protein [Actinomycetota bacterium]
MWRRGGGLRLVPAAGPPRRIGEKDRQEARGLLARAQREGRFGASDVYEQRLEALAVAVTRRDVDVLVADLDELVPEPLRAHVLAVVRQAYADGTLPADGFDERTERCLGMLTAKEAAALVADLGYQIERAGRAQRLRALASRVAPPAAVGICSGAAVLAAPVALGTGVAHWMPLAVGTGVFGAVCASGVALAWRLRPRPAWRAPTRTRELREPGRGARPEGSETSGSEG